MIDTFISENLVWIITAVFGAGGFFWMVRSLTTRLDRHEARLDQHFDALRSRDLEHDKEISDLKSRVSALEVTAQALTRIEGQIADIWKQIMRQSQSK